MVHRSNSSLYRVQTAGETLPQLKYRRYFWLRAIQAGVTSGILFMFSFMGLSNVHSFGSAMIAAILLFSFFFVLSCLLLSIRERLLRVSNGSLRIWPFVQVPVREIERVRCNVGGVWITRFGVEYQLCGWEVENGEEIASSIAMMSKSLPNAS
jgi:hypothetical protein